MQGAGIGVLEEEGLRSRDRNLVGSIILPGCLGGSTAMDDPSETVEPAWAYQFAFPQVRFTRCSTPEAHAPSTFEMRPWPRSKGGHSQPL